MHIEQVNAAIELIARALEVVGVAAIALAFHQSGADIVISEIGGTIGDIEGLPFIEAARQFQLLLSQRPLALGRQQTRIQIMRLRRIRLIRQHLSDDVVGLRQMACIQQGRRLLQGRRPRHARPHTRETRPPLTLAEPATLAPYDNGRRPCGRQPGWI